MRSFAMIAGLLLAPATAHAIALTVVVDPPGAGNVRAPDDGVFCPPTCAVEIEAPRTIVFDAEAYVGYRFADWSICDEPLGEHRCRHHVAEETTLTASFEPLPPPEIVVQPEELDFDRAAVGYAGGEQTVTLSNAGTLPLPILGIRLEGEAFSAPPASCSGVRLEGDAVCTFDVGFLPPSAGEHAGVVVVLSEDPERDEVEVTLSGVGVPPPAYHVLEVVQVPPGGGGCLGNYVLCTQTAPSCAFELRDGLAERLVARPRLGWEHTGWEGCDRVEDGACHVALTGDRRISSTFAQRPDPPSLEVGCDRTNFAHVPVGTRATAACEVRNVGTGTLEVESVAFEKETELSVVDDGCTGQAVEPEATCSFGVAWQVTRIQSVNTDLVLRSNDPAEPTRRYSFKGLAVEPEAEPEPPVQIARVVVSPATHAFPDVAVGAASEPFAFSVRNDGEGPLVDRFRPHVDGEAQFDFSIVRNTCRYRAVHTDGTCELSVVFMPTSAGEKQADLYAGDPVVRLSGTALPGAGSGGGGVCAQRPGAGAEPPWWATWLRRR